MKKIMTAVLLACSGIASAQLAVAPSTCDTTFMWRVREEAITITIQQARLSGNPVANAVLVPYSAYQRTAEELSAIYRVKDSIPELDTIFTYLSEDGPQVKGGIAPQIQNGLHIVQLAADTNVGWVANLAHGIYPTGNFSADSLLAMCRLSAITAGNCCDDPASVISFSLSSDQVAFNPYALGARFALLPGVRSYHAFLPSEMPGSDWSCITRADSGSFVQYRFKYSFGDCMPDCYSHHYWVVKVHSDCAVELDSSYGNRVSIFTSIPSIAERLIAFYPNPTSGVLYINSNADEISITDLTGRSYAVPHSSREIDVSGLAAGVYVLHVQSREGSAVRRFVRE